MGSDAHLIVVGPDPALLQYGRHRIDELERRWSRFVETSEISRLNAAAGSWLPVSNDTITLVSRALEGWRLSGGAFDPTVLGALIRAGYDRSFESPPADAQPPASRLSLGAAQIAIEGTAIRLPPGTGFDPGGIGKGLAADLVANELMAAGALGACVNLGGDVRVAGIGPRGAAWTVAVEHPLSVDPVALLGMADGAVATSTSLLRRWSVAGQERHHLIDPRTGQPSDSQVAFAAVVAGEAWMAEVLAKAVVLAGSHHPFDIVGGTGAEALAVDDRGCIHATDGLRRYLGGVALAPTMTGRRSQVRADSACGLSPV